MPDEEKPLYYYYTYSIARCLEKDLFTAIQVAFPDEAPGDEASIRVNRYNIKINNVSIALRVTSKAKNSYNFVHLSTSLPQNASYYIWIFNPDKQLNAICSSRNPDTIDPVRIREALRQIIEKSTSTEDTGIFHACTYSDQDDGSTLAKFESYTEMLDKISEVCHIVPPFMKARLKDILTKGRTKQIILTGAPGTGKTFTATRVVEEKIREQLRNARKAAPTENGEKSPSQEEKEEIQSYYRLVQFHPSYDYSDFVEGLRPAVLRGKDEASFVRLDGSFKAFCRKIVEKTRDGETDMNYYFIIDEINRADLSQVFGELMYGLEESYRGRRHSFRTRLQNLPVFRIAEDGKADPLTNDVFKDGFYIPENLYIIGTMNEIDRSVEAFDFALRRRFRWIEVSPEFEFRSALIQGMWDLPEEDVEDLISRAVRMNKIICGGTGSTDAGRRIGLGSSYQIGHAYFKNCRSLFSGAGSLETIWKQRIQPLLREYCRGQNPETAERFIKDCHDALTNKKSAKWGDN